MTSMSVTYFETLALYDTDRILSLKDSKQARLCYCFDLKFAIRLLVNSSTGKNINCSLNLKILRLFFILVPVKGLSIIFSAFWRLSKNLELKECLCS